MLAVIFLPQLSPATALPGTKGTLMAALGIVAAVAAVITALQWLAYLGLLGSLNTIILLVTLVGTLVMAWAGWQELGNQVFSTVDGNGVCRVGLEPRPEVGRRTGCSDPGYFVKSFRRAHGTTPLGWRRAAGGPTAATALVAS